MPPLLHQATGRIRVATITDQFTHNSFRQEFNAIPVEPSNWVESFERHSPQLLFCESTWAGLDLVRKPWEGGVHSHGNPVRNEALKSILLHCRAHGIPTIFWNKEDPAFYGHPRTDFSGTAAMFDFIFTSAEECVERYRRDYGRKAFVLPFAANQHLFNPVETAPRSSSLVFAGSWYPQFPRRAVEMEAIVDQFARNGYGIEIYARFHGPGEALNRWPIKYRPYLKPGVPHERMPAIYKSSRFGLNINTVTRSKTMFARRVFELMACNTLVISNFSIGMKAFFGDLAIFADRDPDRLAALREDEVDALRQAALLRVLRYHTYTQRWRRILAVLGLQSPTDRLSTAWICPAGTGDACREAIARFGSGTTGLAGLVLLAQPPLCVQDVQSFVPEGADRGIVASGTGELPEKLDLLGADCFLLSDTASLPPAQWIDEARLHLSYMRAHALTPARGPRYRLTEWRREQPVLGDRTLLEMATPHSGINARRVYPV